MLNKKAETMSDKKYVLYFCYDVCPIHELDERPQFHIVPTSYVANKAIKKGHQEWLNTLGRGGKKEKILI